PDCVYRFDDVALVESFVDIIADPFARRFNTKGEPLNPGTFEFFHHAFLHSVDSSVSPNIEIVMTLNDEVAKIYYVLRIKHKQLVRDLDIPHSILIHKFFNFGADRLGFPHPVAVDRRFESHERLTGFERGLNTAKAARGRTPQSRVEGGVRLAHQITKAMPIVGPVLLHRQKIPSQPWHFKVQIFDQRCGSGVGNSIAVAVYKPAYFAKIPFVIVEGLE